MTTPCANKEEGHGLCVRPACRLEENSFLVLALRARHLLGARERGISGDVAYDSRPFWHGVQHLVSIYDPSTCSLLIVAVLARQLQDLLSRSPWVKDVRATPPPPKKRKTEEEEEKEEKGKKEKEGWVSLNQQHRNEACFSFPAVSVLPLRTEVHVAPSPFLPSPPAQERNKTLDQRRR